MKIAVIGAGALGLYYGAMLQRAGHDVRFLLRRDFQAISRKGLQVHSVKGDFHLPAVQAFERPEEMGEVDLILIGLKTYSNDRMVPLLEPLVGEGTAILTLQNGLGNEELLAEAFGPQRVLGGIAFLCSNRGEPGTVHHLGEGRIRLGEHAEGLTPRARALARTFSEAGVPCEAVADLLRARWEKLVWNIPFNGLCALLRLTTSELLASPLLRAECLGLMEEVVAGANAHPLAEQIDGPAFIERMMSMTGAMDHYRPSMMIDRLEGRPLELASIYAIPLERAARHGVEMTRVRMLYALLAAGEKG